jgi:hypothetical protein
MNAIAKWLKSRNITSHTIAGVVASAFALYSSDQQFRDFVIASLQQHPKILAGIATAAGIYFKYSGAHSPSGVIQEAVAVQKQATAAETKP